jgi:alpha-tubulin suppressor-like RCC1 family protein
VVIIKNGQLGLGDNIDRNVPVQIQDLKVKQVSAGSRFTVAIDLEDNVWVFGANEYGQLGLNDCSDRNVPTKIPNLKAKQVSTGYEHTAVMDLNNDIWVFGSNNYGRLGSGDYEKIKYAPTRIENIKAK